MSELYYGTVIRALSNNKAGMAVTYYYQPFKGCHRIGISTIPFNSLHQIVNFLLLKTFMYIQTLGILSVIAPPSQKQKQIFSCTSSISCTNQLYVFVWSIINSYLSCRLEPSCLQDVTVTGSTIHYKIIIYHFSNFSWVQIIDVINNNQIVAKNRQMAFRSVLVHLLEILEE